MRPIHLKWCRTARSKGGVPLGCLRASVHTRLAVYTVRWNLSLAFAAALSFLAFIQNAGFLIRCSLGHWYFSVIIVVDIDRRAAHDVGQWGAYEADFANTVIILPAQ